MTEKRPRRDEEIMLSGPEGDIVTLGGEGKGTCNVGRGIIVIHMSPATCRVQVLSASDQMLSM